METLFSTYFDHTILKNLFNKKMPSQLELFVFCSYLQQDPLKLKQKAARGENNTSQKIGNTFYLGWVSLPDHLMHA